MGPARMDTDVTNNPHSKILQMDVAGPYLDTNTGWYTFCRRAGLYSEGLVYYGGQLWLD